MTETVTKQAIVTHVELPILSSKQDEVKKFYEDIFGWNISFDMMPDYGMTQGLEPSIGLPIRDEVNEERRGIYLEVQDIEQTLEYIEKRGGKIVTKKNLISEDIGFGASFKDPSGNIVGLFAKS